MGEVTPVRIILRYRERPFQSLDAIIGAFLEWRHIDTEDYYMHICSDIHPSSLYLVLDLYYTTCPDVDLDRLDLEVFKASGAGPFTFRDLGEEARRQVYPRSVSLEWGGPPPPA